MIASGALPALPRFAADVRRRLPPGAALGILVVGLIVAVFPVSLATLLGSLSADTPLAYLGIVPVLALGIALAQRRPAEGDRVDRDPELDAILATFFLAFAATLLLFEPLRLSAQYWQLRIDILSLPFFAAGVITAVHGTRMLWRLRFAIGFLFIAWPLPWTSVLGQLLSVDVTGTLQILHVLGPHLGLATVVPGTDGSVFALGPAGHPFQLSVSAPCAGSNTTVGYLVVGGACTALLDGSRRRKLIWLAAGAALTWLLNIGRILLIFLVGNHFGQDLALNLVHPAVGCVLLIGGVFFMTALLPHFGLRFRTRGDAPPAAPKIPISATTRRRLSRRGIALLIVTFLAVPLAAADAGFTRYSLVADALGSARLTSFTAHPVHASTWSLSWATRYDWSKEFFGSDSTWNRYVYGPSWSHGPTGEPVYADAVLTSSLASLQNYGVEACYNFHGDDISYDQSLNLPGGLVAQTLVYRTPGADTTWAVLDWTWPVLDGGVQRYERIVLTAVGDSAQLPVLTQLASGIITSQVAAS